MRTVYLSHFLNEKTPLYGGDKLISIKNRTRISKGDSSNTCLLKLPNHSGTHIDFPYHFSENGNTLNDISPSFWSFEKVHVIPLSVEILTK